MIIDVSNIIGKHKFKNEIKAEDLLNQMDKAGIDIAVIHCFAEFEDNESIYDACKKYPNRFLGLYTVNPWKNNACELFEKANEKLVNNKLKFNKNQTDGNREYLLTSKIKCEHCGGTFKRRVLRNKEYWSCSNHVTSAKKCEVKMIGTDEIDDAFLKIFYKLKGNIHVLEAYKKHIVNFTTNDDDRCELDLVNRELKK